MELILASGSPRRQELLKMLGIPFTVVVSETEEETGCSDPARVTEELSRRKAEAAAEQIEEGVVIGADTVVACQGTILGKPRDAAMATDMLSSLRGREHMVYTGVTVLVKKGPDRKTITFSEGTGVRIAPMTDREIADYIATGEPYDKAGGYGIQGTFGKFVEGIHGDYYNVVGLPLHRLYEALKTVRKDLQESGQEPAGRADPHGGLSCG